MGNSSQNLSLRHYHTKTLPFLFILLIAMINLPKIYSKTCKESSSLSETDCFNRILYLNRDDRHYRAGHYATSKDGDLIIEYSGDGPSQYRMFFGLQKNGRGYFNEEILKEKELANPDGDTGRYESRNIFIHSYENNEFEYLFSVSAYLSATELHDLKNDQYKIAETHTFLGRTIFSYVYNIIEVNEDGKTFYFIFYTSPNGDSNPTEDNGQKFVIKKMKFTEFKLEKATSHIDWKIENKHNDRVVCGFHFENHQSIGIMFIRSNNPTYVVRFYDYNLNQIGGEIALYNTELTNPETGHGKYLQAIHLKDNVVAFFYFHTDGHPLKLQVLHFTKSDSGYSNSDRLFLDWTDFSFNDEIYLNDIYKISDDRLAFFSTAQNSAQKLYFLFLDFFNDYKSLKTRYYEFDTPYDINKEFQVYSYNGFVTFTSTINSNDFNSILMFFSYPNGTDFELDISPYIKNADEYISSNKIYTALIDKMTIENNIFGYKSSGQIKLISIPEQLAFYSSDSSTSPLQNGDEIDINSVL